MNARVVLVGGQAERAKAEALATEHAHPVAGGAMDFAETTHAIPSPMPW